MFWDSKNRDQFIYGKTCQRVPQHVADLRRRSRFMGASSYKMRLAGIALATTVGSSIITKMSNLQHVISPLAAEVKFKSVPGQVGLKVKEAREDLGLTQKELAKMLAVSESTLQKTELGETQTPREAGLRNYYAFLELNRYLDQVTGGRRFFKRQIVKTPFSSLGEKTPLEFVQNGEDVRFPSLIGILKRIYG